jgi:hypothetical protein
MQPTFSPKNAISHHYAHNVFLDNPFEQGPTPLLKNGQLFLSIFTERCHFFSGLFRE